MARLFGMAILNYMLVLPTKLEINIVRVEWLISGEVAFFITVFSITNPALSLWLIAFIFPIYPQHLAVRIGELLPLVTGTRILLVLGLCSWFLQRRNRTQPFIVKTNPILVPMLFCASIWLLSSFLSVDVAVSLKNSFHLIVEGFLVFFWLGNLGIKKHIKTLFSAWFSAAALVALASIYEFVKQQNLFSDIPVSSNVFVDQRTIIRAGFTIIRVMFQNHIELGAFLMVGLFLGIYLIRTQSTRSGRVIYIIFYIVITIALLLTMARGAYLGLFGGLLIITKDKRRIQLFLGALLVVAFLVDQSGLLRALVGFRTSEKRYEVFSSNLAGRAEIIENAFSSINKLPILGRGPATANLFPSTNNIYDSLFAQLIFDVGIIGLLSMLWLLGAVFWVIWSRIRNREHDHVYLLGLTCLSVVVAYSLLNFSSMPLLVSSQLNPLFWGIAGIGVFTVLKESKKRGSGCPRIFQ